MSCQRLINNIKKNKKVENKLEKHKYEDKYSKLVFNLFNYLKIYQIGEKE